MQKLIDLVFNYLYIVILPTLAGLIIVSAFMIWLWPDASKLTSLEQAECDYVTSMMKLSEPDFICECERGEYGINKHCYNPRYASGPNKSNK